MTAAVLALPAPLCEICGDGAPEDYRPDTEYAARGVIFDDSPICVECAAFSVWDGMHEAADFTWWTDAAEVAFAAQVKSLREKCECGEMRDDFGACWKCDAVDCRDVSR